MAEFARFGALQDLTNVIDVSAYKNQTVPTFIDLGTVDGKLVGVFIKATLKGLIWYNPKVYTLAAPTTWTGLKADADLAKREQNAWCMGLGSDATSGWPGTDWIEDFVLRESGPDVYDDWVAGKLPWTSPQIKSAFMHYGKVVADSAGGPTAVIATDFQNGGNGLFTDPPTCIFHHQATFMTEFFKSQAGARDGEYDFFPFPTIDERFANDVTGAGDLFGMFRDTPQARALISYLVTPEAQSIWVARGGALSVNVEVTDYPDDISRRAAQILTSANRFRFDGSDLMPEQLNAAFLQGVIEYTGEPVGPRLDPAAARRCQSFVGDHGALGHEKRRPRPSAPAAGHSLGAPAGNFPADPDCACGRPRRRAVGRHALPTAAHHVHPGQRRLRRRDVLRDLLRRDGLVARDQAPAQPDRLDLPRARRVDGHPAHRDVHRRRRLPRRCARSRLRCSSGPGQRHRCTCRC